jgi:hypothetical protein
LLVCSPKLVKLHTSSVHLQDRSEAYHNPNHIHQPPQPAEIRVPG